MARHDIRPDRRFLRCIAACTLATSACSALDSVERAQIRNRVEASCGGGDALTPAVASHGGAYCIEGSRFGWEGSGGAWRPTIPPEVVRVGLTRFTGIDALCVHFDEIVDGVRRALEQHGMGHAYAVCPELREVAFRYDASRRELHFTDQSPDAESGRKSGSILIEGVDLQQTNPGASAATR